MKKTTAKEFKELIIKVYGEFDYDRIINQLSLLESMTHDDYYDKGLDAIANVSKERSNKLYDYLVNKGYYDYIESNNF